MIISTIKHNRKIYKKKKIIKNKYVHYLVIFGNFDHFTFNKVLISQEISYKNYENVPTFEKILFKMYSQLILM